MKRFLVCASAGAMLALSACGGNEQNDTSQNAVGFPMPEALPPPGAPANPPPAAAAGAIPENGRFLIGRWALTDSCDRTVEFREDGTVINFAGANAGRWSVQGSPPVVTFDTPSGPVSGVVEPTREGLRIRPTGSAQTLNFFRCDSAAGPGARGGAGGALTPTPSPPSGTAGFTPPRLIGGSITDADYPASAIRAEAQGTTRVAVMIDNGGRVTGCRVVTTSGNAALDSTTCSLVQRRFRFQPGMRSGRPIPTELELSRVWRLPRN